MNYTHWTIHWILLDNTPGQYTGYSWTIHWILLDNTLDTPAQYIGYSCTILLDNTLDTPGQLFNFSVVIARLFCQLSSKLSIKLGENILANDLKVSMEAIELSLLAMSCD